MRIHLYCLTILIVLLEFGTGKSKWLMGYENGMENVHDNFRWVADEAKDKLNRRLQSEGGGEDATPTLEPTPFPTFEFAPSNVPSGQPTSSPTGIHCLMAMRCAPCTAAAPQPAPLLMALHHGVAGLVQASVRAEVQPS